MTGHDQFFKKLFQTFFGDLLRLVAPELLGTLRVERAQFRDQQSFTDWPAGSRREVDLLAEVERSDGEPPVLAAVRNRVVLAIWARFLVRGEESSVAEGDVVDIAGFEILGRELIQDVGVVGERADGWERSALAE